MPAEPVPRPRSEAGACVESRVLRIHFVSHSFAPEHAPLTNVGGMQRVAMELAAAFEARDDVSLSLDVLRASWERIGWTAPRFLAGLPGRLLRLDASVDVVLFASITSALAALPVFGTLRARGVRLAAIAHGLDVTQPNPAYQLAVRAALARLDVVLPVSRATEARCRERGARRTEVVPNGVDLLRFAPKSGPSALRGAGKEHDTFVLLTVGRHVPRKGFAWFVSEVMPRLDRRVRLVLVGDGPERATIERAARSNGVTDRVDVRGLCSEAELHGCLTRADLLVMPNVVVAGDMEGFGIVLLEAGAMGVPVLAAELEGINDVVVPGVTGELVRSGDADAWVRAIEALRVEPERRRALGDAAAREVPGRFSWDSIGARHLDALRPSRVREAV